MTPLLSCSSGAKANLTDSCCVETYGGLVVRVILGLDADMGHLSLTPRIAGDSILEYIYGSGIPGANLAEGYMDYPRTMAW